jgi:hypothetical protein
LLLAQAVEAEVSVFLASHEDLTLPDGRRRLARHGHLPERQIQTGIGAVKRQPRVRDRAGDSDERIRFSPSILPHYARRTESLEVLIPWLYLNGISSGDFREALVALLGKDAPNLSADTVLRLRQTWQGELERCEGRDLSARRYVYVWGRPRDLSPGHLDGRGQDRGGKGLRYLSGQIRRQVRQGRPLSRKGSRCAADLLRTSNPIESTFATVRHRTKRSKGCLSRKTAKIMIFKLIMAAQQS